MRHFTLSCLVVSHANHIGLSFVLTKAPTLFSFAWCKWCHEVAHFSCRFKSVTWGVYDFLQLNMMASCLAVVTVFDHYVNKGNKYKDDYCVWLLCLEFWMVVDVLFHFTDNEPLPPFLYRWMFEWLIFFFAYMKHNSEAFYLRLLRSNKMEMLTSVLFTKFCVLTELLFFAIVYRNQRTFRPKKSAPTGTKVCFLDELPILQMPYEMCLNLKLLVLYSNLWCIYLQSVPI